VLLYFEIFKKKRFLSKQFPQF
jgi:hypothetical protein